jgi:hypothetical protein
MAKTIFPDAKHKNAKIQVIFQVATTTECNLLTTKEVKM